MQMAYISESKFAEICDGIRADREIIIKHNPIGSDEEILLWMLLSCLISFLSIEENETPCFTGRPDAETYRKAIKFVLDGRMETAFDVERNLDEMTAGAGVSRPS
jgi:hypothetical protein